MSFGITEFKIEVVLVSNLTLVILIGKLLWVRTIINIQEAYGFIRFVRSGLQVIRHERSYLTKLVGGLLLVVFRSFYMKNGNCLG